MTIIIIFFKLAILKWVFYSSCDNSTTSHHTIATAQDQTSSLFTWIAAKVS